MIQAMKAPYHRRITKLLHLGRRVASDSLVRNAMLLMASTVISAGLGYLFWAIAAHMLTRQEVGLGSAAISLCATVALLTYLGASAVLIERLPAAEHSDEWSALLRRMCFRTAAAAAAATAAIVPALRISGEYRVLLRNALSAPTLIAGAAVWTVVSLQASAFIAARRADKLLANQALISLVKLILILPFVALSSGAAGLVYAWVVSALVGAGVGAGWTIPRLGLGRPPVHRPRRRLAASQLPTSRAPCGSSHCRPPRPPSTVAIRRMLGHHLTSVGGAVTPLLLPGLVLVRLGAAQNAYFYITWMVSGAFFTVSPSIAWTLFSEGVREGTELRRVVAKSLRITFFLLLPIVAAAIICGRFILGLFGTTYATAGYGLLVLLAISALPDAVSNVAVTILRITDSLVYSSLLNLTILVATVTGAWILMPSLGIAGAGTGWLAAQFLGTLISLPAYRRAIGFRRSGSLQRTFVRSAEAEP